MDRQPKIVILTGAGISAESGIATFRASDGLWENHRIEDVASPEGFVRDPALVHTFYNGRRQQILHPDIRPNAAHRALARLEQSHGGGVLIVTQNIDNLHERAGSRNVLHMHGDILQIRCQQTEAVYRCEDDIGVNTDCQCCGRPGNLRPNIVWFGEMPFHMDAIYQAVSVCDYFVAVGTSGHVYPAAGLVEVARQAGAKTVEINLQQSAVATAFAEGFYGAATEQVPRWVEQILTQEA